MPSLSVCILTFNSHRTLARCLAPAREIADELIVVDSGSTDGTLAFLAEQGIQPIHRPYRSHSDQMNFAIDQAENDWVLCLDSDEFLDTQTLGAIRALKPELEDPTIGYRIRRYWHVLGKEVHAIYPVSSPDFPLRLFNRQQARFNGQPVDDKATGAKTRLVLPGHVVHDTFFSLHEVFAKLNSYTSRLITLQDIPPSLWRALLAPLPAFAKWYFRKGAWRDGTVGVITGVYAAGYTFLKYFKAWCKARGTPI